MRVERFFLFFPPKVVSIRRGETEYGIGAIPLGGFVKITGMNPEEEIPPEVVDRAYYRQPVWKRIVVIAAGPFVNIVLALILFFALAVGFGLDTGPTNRVGTVSPDLPAANLLQPGDKLVSVDGERVGDLPPAKLAEAVRDQVATHTLRRHADRRLRRDHGREAEGDPRRQPGHGPRQAGSTTLPEQVPGGPPSSRGWWSGSATSRSARPCRAGEAASFAVDRLWYVTSQTATVFSRILDPQVRDQISGVVGATEVTRQSFEFDTRQAIGVLAVISLSLGLINLLPFLPLDGGHIFWAIVEKIRGRPVPLRIMERSGMIGFALVLILFVIGLENDIGRLTGEGFNVR